MSVEILFGVGTVILFGILIYGTMFWHGRRRSLDSITEAGTRRNYKQEEEAAPDKGVSVRWTD
jgi:hypothetical protein